MKNIIALMITTLIPISTMGQSVGLLHGDGQDGSGSEAYRWARQRANAEVIDFNALQNSLEKYDAIWWHVTNSANLPEKATDSEVIELIRDYIQEGGGVLLSGYAPQYAATLGLTETPPTTIVREPTRSANWGFQPKCTNHPVFSGLTSPVYTLSGGVDVENIITWWDNPADFDGTWLADTENSIGKMAIGEIRYGLGKVIVVGGGAFEWEAGASVNTHHKTLTKLAENMLDYLSSPSPVPVNEPSLAARWEFEGETGDSTATDLATGQVDSIQNNFDRPERYALDDGSTALVMDGYSTYIQRDSACAPILIDEATWSAWFAPRSYPIQTAPIFQQISGDAGYSFEMTRYGQWGLRVNIDGIWHALWAPEPLPKDTWNHMAAVYKRGEGISLYLNGEQVSHQPAYLGFIRTARDEPFFIGRSRDTGFIAEIFPLALINGLLDEARIYRRALSSEELASMAEEPRYAEPPSHLQLSPDRFADDPHRPVYHALPESDWTNEPHGLVQMPDGRYHLYFQKNPAGPYWQFLHWGHVSSTDLVHWRNEPAALAPEPGMDQEGVWSGHAVEDDGVLKLIYTGIDGHRAVMALATPVNEERTIYKKYAGNPIVDGRPKNEPLMDFRDPFLWQEGNLWHMIIGAGVPDVGGTALHYRSPAVEGPWQYTGHFFSGKKERTGFYWEMPIYIPFDEDRALFGVTEMPAINEYWIGRHQDGKFIADSEEPRPLEVINHLLSPTPVQANDGRWIAIGIIPETRSSQEQLDAGWAHLFSMPRVWNLHPEMDILLQSPAEELQSMRTDHVTLADLELPAGEWVVLEGMDGSVGELLIDVEKGNAERIEVAVRRSPDGREQTGFSFDLSSRELTVDRRQSSLNPEVQRDIRTGNYPMIETRDTLRLHLFLDNSVIEGFVNEGHAFATRVYPTLADSTGIAIRVSGEDVELRRADYWTLQLPSEERPAASGGK